jgi:hypothetical protein
LTARRLVGMRVRGSDHHFSQESPMLTALTVLAALAGVTADIPPREAPSDAAVLRALPCVARGIPCVYQESRDNIVIVKNHLAWGTVSAPLFEGVTVNVRKDRYKCVAYYERVIESDFPFSLQLRKREVSVVFVDKREVSVVFTDELKPAK